MKKRGLLLVVLLVLSILYSAMVLGEVNGDDEKPKEVSDKDIVELEKYTSYEAIAISNNCD